MMLVVRFCSPELISASLSALVQTEASLDDTSLPTWAMCEQILMGVILERESQSVCDEHCPTSPMERLDGIRFIMLQDMSGCVRRE